ncbi:hypothetical protein KQR57_10515 [Bacillus inaquosorum]|nr:hypothetical protein [Bacillus inaquosorum]
MHVQIPLRNVFRFPTIEQLARKSRRWSKPGMPGFLQLRKDHIIRYLRRKNDCTFSIIWKAENSVTTCWV